MPGGYSTATALLQTNPGFRSEALDPGRRFQVYKGISTVWEGVLQEPVPSKDGMQLTATGLGVLGANYDSYYTTWDFGTHSLNDPVNQAILRGLPWNPTNLTTGWVQAQPDNASFTVTDHLNSVTSKQGMLWQVDRRHNVQVYPIPTTVDRLLIATDPVARTLFTDITTLWIMFTASDDGNGNTVTQLTCVFNQADIDAHGANESYIDLTNAGVMSMAGAQQAGQNLLNRYGRAMWSGSFTIRPGQLMTIGGSAIDLATETVGHVCRLLCADDPMGGEVSPSSDGLNFIGGGYSYNDDTQLATVTPLQTFNHDFGSLLAGIENF